MNKNRPEDSPGIKPGKASPLQKKEVVRKKENMQIIGRKDKADFPEFGFENIEVKIDTGAYSSSLHCHRIEEVEISGKKLLKFRLLDPYHPEYEARDFYAKKYDIKRVKSSTGESETRYFIETTVVLFGEQITTGFTLTDREAMKTPVLLGRKLLRQRFLVDVTKKNLSLKKKIKSTSY